MARKDGTGGGKTRSPRAQAQPRSGLGDARHRLLRAAANQAAAAYELGFAVESLMLLESILADRIESRMQYLSKKPVPRSLGPMLDALRAVENVEAFRALIGRVQAWKDDRNEAAHGMAKLMDRDGPSWEERYAAAAAATVVGAQLVLDFAVIDEKERLEAGVRPPATHPGALHALEAVAAGRASRRMRRRR